MKATTLCFLLRDKEVLLAMKKRGFGAGKWNGTGGKLNEDESAAAAAIREVAEEIGAIIAPEELKDAGTIEFIYRDSPDWNTLSYVFTAEKWNGDLSESEEMKPAWFASDKLPFESMWIDDPHWVPKIVSGKKIKARFIFDKKGTELAEYEVIEL
jgi:8-oxo-dGTP diphosphatase